MWKGKEPDSDPDPYRYLWLMDPDPDPQHWSLQKLAAALQPLHWTTIISWCTRTGTGTQPIRFCLSIWYFTPPETLFLRYGFSYTFLMHIPCTGMQIVIKEILVQVPDLNIIYGIVMFFLTEQSNIKRKCFYFSVSSGSARCARLNSQQPFLKYLFFFLSIWLQTLEIFCILVSWERD